MVEWTGQSGGISGGILTVLSTDKSYYNTGEPVRMCLFLQNVFPYPITFTYSTTQRYDFAVAGASEQVWRWSSDRVFIPVIETVTLNPGEYRRYFETWPQLNQSGRVVPPGFYSITGWSTASNAYQPKQSVLISITI